MVFVNTIGECVHSKTDKFCGSANKNIGDAFLLVWKFPIDEVRLLSLIVKLIFLQVEMYEDGRVDIRRSRVTKNICDLSLIGLCKIIAGINKQPKILAYRKNQKMNNRMPNYKVKLGFGLHLGWQAIIY